MSNFIKFKETQKARAQALIEKYKLKLSGGHGQAMDDPSVPINAICFTGFATINPGDAWNLQLNNLYTNSSLVKITNNKISLPAGHTFVIWANVPIYADSSAGAVEGIISLQGGLNVNGGIIVPGGSVSGDTNAYASTIVSSLSPEQPFTLAVGNADNSSAPMSLYGGNLVIQELFGNWVA